MRSKATKEVINERWNKRVDDYLKNPELMSNIIKELDKVAVGEHHAKSCLLLVFAQIYVADPYMKLNILINAKSSTGKSYVMKQVKEIFPSGNIIYFTRVTPRALDYYPHKKVIDDGFTWDDKILILEDAEEVVLNSDSIKVWMSEGQRTLLLKNQTAILRDLPGTPIICMTFASGIPKTEVLSRCLLISLDESPLQTQSVISHLIKKYQKKDKKDIDELMTYALSKLEKRPVYIPFADKLEFLFPIDNVRIRRYFSMFCELIRSSAVLHQRRRKLDQEGIAATGQDYDIAREVIQGIFKNENMEPLTHKLQKAFDYCIKMNDISIAEDLSSDGWWSAKDIISKYPIVSKSSWYNYLSDFGEYGLLETKLDKQEDSIRGVMKYRAKPYGDFSIPEFGNLE